MQQTKLTEQLKTVFTLQDETNEVAVKDWKAACLDWDSAILVEVGEAIDHLAYKWWSDAPANIEQAQMEMVDILHFLVSRSIVAKGTPITVDRGVNFLSVILMDVFEPKDLIDPAWVIHHLNQMVKYTLEDNIHQAWVFWAAACTHLGLTWDQIYAKYIGKAALNRFRWANGYGSTYQKIWNGREDNEHLTEFLNKFSQHGVEPTVETVLEALDTRYKSVVCC